MAPVFPAGVIIHYDTNPITYSLFVQVLHPLPTEKEILHIPQADFSCLQVAYASQKDVLKIVDEKFPTMEKSMVIMSNLILNVSVNPSPGLQPIAKHETIPPCSVGQCMAVPCTAGETEVFS